METDSPDLFDSEPSLPARLTVAGETDDVLAELVEEINASGADAERAGDDVETAEGDEVRDGVVVAEHRTSDGDAEGDRVAADGSVVDRSAERSGAAKAKDGHRGLPPGRVKLIMKMDPDVNLVAADAVFLLTKATESFVGLLAQHCLKAMAASNKKTLQKKHIDTVIEENVPFEFLEGALDW